MRLFIGIAPVVLVVSGSTLAAQAHHPVVKSQADAETHAHHVMSNGAEIAWIAGPPSLPPGARMSVLEGNPAQAGPFTMRLRFPDGYRIPPHSHPGVERITVISGTFVLGMGAAGDPAGAKPLTAGAFAMMPVGMVHHVLTRGETEVQLNGIGPWAIVYANPAEDPRRRAP